MDAHKSSAIGFLCFFKPKVDDHKTNKTFGQAVLSLKPEEFGWLEKLTLRKCCRGAQGDFVFHTIKGRQILKPLAKLQMAWKDAGMTAPISFNLIRSSVATQVRKII